MHNFQCLLFSLSSNATIIPQSEDEIYSLEDDEESIESTQEDETSNMTEEFSYEGQSMESKIDKIVAECWPK